MRLLAMLVAAFAAALPGQVVRVANYHGAAFTGWIRATVDELPPAPAGLVGDVRYVVGRRVGESTWVVDLQATLKPNQQRSIDLRKPTPAPFEMPPAPKTAGEPITFFGGWPALNGVPLQLVAAGEDGSGVSLHLRARLGSLWHADAWFLWRPDEPGVMHAEIAVCASNPDVPDVVATTDGIRLAWGDGLVFVHGADWGSFVVPPTSFATGQARGVPVTIVWPRNVGENWSPAIAAKERCVCAVGDVQLWPDGNPVLPAGFDGKAWTVARWRESLRRLHTWEPALIGPNVASGDTGAQEDQVFVRAECLSPDGVGAEQIAYLGALKILARPCHHLQVDGAIVDPTAAQPRLVYWDGQPHWHAGVSPNRLGKPRGPSLEERHAWAGPDVEHWLMNTTAAAARLTGSRALQWELEHQAHVWFGQQTIAPGLSTTAPFAARAVGWEAINAVHLWRTLENRELAERVRVRWLQRADLITSTRVPPPVDPNARGESFDATRDQWDVRYNDARLGAGAWWLPWQQAVGAYGLDLAGRVFGHEGARAMADRGAKAVLRDAWARSGDRWVCRPQQAVAGPWQQGDESFAYFGMAMAVAVVLRNDPDDERARGIWAQLTTTSGEGSRWLAPGVAAP